MSKSLKICVLICLILTLNSSAKAITISDTQDATNWGDWFIPDDVEPRSGNPPKYLPYYRWDDNDWGWIHTLTFDVPVKEILSATLEIEAWDVGLYQHEVHDIYGDDIYLGSLTPPSGIEDIPPSTWYDIGWSTTEIALEPEAMEALMDGTMDIWIDIDAFAMMGPGEGCQAVTIGSSTLTVTYTDIPLDDPNIPLDDPNIPPDDPVIPPDDPVIPPDDPIIPPDDPNVELKSYIFNPVDVSLPTINDPGDGISQIGVEQAWFAFDISSIPDDEQIVSASFSADMRDFDGDPTERTLWYDSDDSWIETSISNLSDPGNSAADNIIGTVTFNNQAYTWITIDIAHDWTNDLADDYITLMLTGPQTGSYSSGAVNIVTAELEIITFTDSGQINNEGMLLNLGPEELVRADGLDVVVPGYSVPSLFDWNNDGLQDLIIGEGGDSGDARMRVYLNFGTEFYPQFFSYFNVRSNGSDLTCPATGCLGCFPRVLYWDADSCKDLLVGQADGTVKIFLNVWTDSNPIFDGGTFLDVGKPGLKKPINVGYRATPSVVDWNNDGRKDLVVGALDGRIHIFINEGTDTEPDFISESFAQENGSDLFVPSYRSSPEVFDLDLDGRKDILTGNTDGQLLLYSNVGTDKVPNFSGYSFVESDGIAIDLAGSPRSRPYVCYWDEDIYPDVLIGAGDGKVHLYQGVPIPDDIGLIK